LKLFVVPLYLQLNLICSSKKKKGQNKLHTQFSDFILNTSGKSVQQSESVAEHQIFLFLLRRLHPSSKKSKPVDLTL